MHLEYHVIGNWEVGLCHQMAPEVDLWEREEVARWEARLVKVYWGVIAVWVRRKDRREGCDEYCSNRNNILLILVVNRPTAHSTVSLRRENGRGRPVLRLLFECTLGNLAIHLLANMRFPIT